MALEKEAELLVDVEFGAFESSRGERRVRQG
jgi:hypothetical protein